MSKNFLQKAILNKHLDSKINVSSKATLAYM